MRPQHLHASKYVTAYQFAKVTHKHSLPPYRCIYPACSILTAQPPLHQYNIKRKHIVMFICCVLQPHALCHLNHDMVLLFCAVYHMSGWRQWPPLLHNTALWSDVVCLFLCTTDDVCAGHTLIHYVCHIMHCMLFITTCLKHCHMSNEQHYVHSVREPLPALLQYLHFSQTPWFYNMASLCSPVANLQPPLTIIFNKLILNSIHLVEMAMELSLRTYIKCQHPKKP